MWAWNFFMHLTNMFFRVVFVTCLLALVSANPLENGFETRIVGGRDAKKKEFPHQVSMQYINIHDHRCGGTILSPIWVATAAHCVDGDRPKFVIKAGKLNITIAEATEQIVEVERIFPHEHFTRNARRNDIALVKLVKPLKFNEYVNKIDLPVKGSEPTGTAILSGWGSISKTLEPLFPQLLQAVTMNLLDAEACTRVFKEITHSPGSIDSNNVCTTGNAGLSASSGDSGSPLIQGKKFIGIVSNAFIPPHGPTRLTVHTKVSSFVDWINDKMRHH